MDDLPKDYWVSSMQFTPKTYQDVYPAIDPRKSSNSLAGKVVIITGASQGVGGKGIAPAFAKAGPKAMVLLARGADKLKEVEATVRSIDGRIETLAVAADISDEASVASVFEQVRARFGHADVLVNNATVNEGGPVIHEAEPAAWWHNFEVNVRGPFLLAKIFISQLPAPPSSKATIITLTSFGSYKVFPFMAGYSISKLGAQMLAANLAAAYPDRLVSAIVHPGLVETRQLLPAFSRFDLDQPELAGGLAVWIAADPDRSHFLSGRLVSANWDVDGLLERKDEIVRDNLLTLGLVGKFGREQFEGK